MISPTIWPIKYLTYLWHLAKIDGRNGESEIVFTILESEVLMGLSFIQQLAGTTYVIVDLIGFPCESKIFMTMAWNTQQVLDDALEYDGSNNFNMMAVLA
ncbi:hypothetical protein ACTFIT_008758 [Dictyostelium discoideum]